MNTVLIIQARMGSSRLPNKVLKKICDKPMLEHILKRTLQSKKVEHVMVATTLNEEDKQIDELCHKIGIDCFVVPKTMFWIDIIRRPNSIILGMWLELQQIVH